MKSTWYKGHISVIGFVVLVLILVAFLSAQTAVFPGACTTFLAHLGDTSLFGNNEDYSNPHTLVWVVPSTEDSYGGIYLGYARGRPQGGINEKGLAFDGLAIPSYRMNDHPELPDVSIISTNLWKEIMSKSANVEEAIEMARRYNWADPTPHQVLFADKSGDAAVIGPGVDGEIAVTRKPAGESYLVATNFNVADPDVTESCWRYETATKMLAKIQNEDDLTVKAFQKILEAVHVEGDTNNTLYSNVFDLNTGTVYLYYWHQYGEVITLNVDDEIARGASVRQIQELFSENTVTRAETEFRRYMGEIPLVEEYFLTGWYALAGILLLVFLWDVVTKKAPRTGLNLYWGLVLTISGVIGFAGYWFSYRKPHNSRSDQLSTWMKASGAAAISATGYAATFLSILAVFHFFFPQGTSGMTSLLIPFIIGLLLFRGPVLTIVARGKYFPVILRTILTELISTLFALASVIFVDSVLKGAYPKVASPDNLMYFGMVSAYALASFIVIFPFHLWMAQKKYTLWIDGFTPEGEIVQTESEMKTLPFRKGWPFLLIGVALLVLAAMT